MCFFGTDQILEVVLKIRDNGAAVKKDLLYT